MLVWQIECQSSIGSNSKEDAAVGGTQSELKIKATSFRAQESSGESSNREMCPCAWEIETGEVGSKITGINMFRVNDSFFNKIGRDGPFFCTSTSISGIEGSMMEYDFIKSPPLSTLFTAAKTVYPCWANWRHISAPIQYKKWRISLSHLQGNRHQWPILPDYQQATALGTVEAPSATPNAAMSKKYSEQSLEIVS